MDEPKYEMKSIKLQDLFRRLADKLDEAERRGIPHSAYESISSLSEAAIKSKEAYDQLCNMPGMWELPPTSDASPVYEPKEIVMEVKRGAIFRTIIVQGCFYPFDPIKRDKRLAYKNPVIFKMKEPDKGGKGWLIGYQTRKGLDGWTGPFKSREDAEGWYNRGGR